MASVLPALRLPYSLGLNAAGFAQANGVVPHLFCEIALGGNGPEFICPACGERLNANPFAAGVLALLLAEFPAASSMSVDDSWPWIAGGFIASVVMTYVLWRALLKIERRW